VNRSPARALACAFALVLVLAVCALPLASCGGSTSTPTSQVDAARDAAVRVDLLSLAIGLKSCRAMTGSYPATLSQETLGAYVTPWPTNPWTGAPMRAGTGEGDFTYTASGGGYSLVAHGSNGQAISAQ